MSRVKRTPSLNATAASIDDVATHANVSIATVSRVLNARGKYSEATKQRVLESIRALHYAPSTAARNLARGQTQTIGLVLPDVSGDFWYPLLCGVVSAATVAGFDILLKLGRSNIHHNPIKPNNVDGLVVFASALSETALRELHTANCPIVLLYQTAPSDLNIPSVLVENRRGMRLATDHLLRLGRQQIAFLRGLDGFEDAIEREQGFRDALKARGIKPDPRLIGNGGFEAAVAELTVTRWLENGVSFDAIVASDDDSASGALKALTRAGVDVPTQVAVVGFDDVPFAAHLNPPLTTVRGVIERVGLEAVRLLVEQIETGSSAMQVRLPTELVVRESCGAHLIRSVA